MTKEYYLTVNREKVRVSEEVYKVYWQITNHEKYLERVDRMNHSFLFSTYSSEVDIENVIPDKTVDIEKIVEIKILMEMVNKAMTNLTEEEREFLNLLYFEGFSLRDLAKIKKIHHSTVIKRRNKIIAKIRRVLKKNSF